jgi:cytosine/adenosine deaminase-related metal-dependent hydrolase
LSKNLIGGLIAVLSFTTAFSAPPPAPLFIEHVTVLPMTPNGAAVADTSVLIQDGRIAAVGAAAAPPRDVTRIDGRGKFLLPGFTDMHVHTPNDRMARLFTGDQSLPDGSVDLADELTPYLANGVLQVFDLQSMSETIGQRIEVESGRVQGPHIATAAMIDGSPPQWPLGMTRVAATPADGRQAVRDAFAEGYGHIKTYSKLTPETFEAIVDEARKLGLRVLGHIPAREKGITADFFRPGFDLVAHAEEFAQQTWPPSLEAIPRYVDMAKRNGTWLTATLTLDERLTEQVRDPASLKARPELVYLHPAVYNVVFNANPYLKDTSARRIAALQSVVDFNRELVKAFAAAGIPVLTGTDSPVPGLAPGFSLHDEFASLSKAGLTNLQVLEATTRLPAEWLGTIKDRGTIEAGKRANLVLLDANPLEDIANTRRIRAVIASGHYLTRAELERRLAKLVEIAGVRAASVNGEVSLSSPTYPAEKFPVARDGGAALYGWLVCGSGAGQ